MFTDFILAFFAWIIIGPPLASFFVSGSVDKTIAVILINFISFLAPVALCLMYFNFNDMYRSIARFYEPVRSIKSNSIGSLIFGVSWLFIYTYNISPLDTSLLLILTLQAFVMSIVFFALSGSARLIAKILLNSNQLDSNASPIVIYGAGASGIELLRVLQADPTKKIICFFDDNIELKGTEIDGIRVLSSLKKLSILLSNHVGAEIYLAIPSINLESRKKIITKLEFLRVPVRTIPSIHELVANKNKIGEVQDLSLEDLLPDSVVNDEFKILLENQNILVTGAGGSIGSEIVRQLLELKPGALILVDFSEMHLHYLYEEIKAYVNNYKLDISLHPILCNVADKQSLDNIFKNYSVDIIYHAAAYKHVPLLEIKDNLLGAIRNNILGTYLVCELADKYQVKKVVMISTDKAVRPTNLMGATKRFAELVAQNFNQDSENTIFTMVRFGNVVNSSGSVIPLFIKQINEGGPVTVTDFEVTRFFMTIPEASNLVIQAGNLAEGGEVFLLDMGKPVKVLDIAKRLIHLKGFNYSIFNDDEGSIRIIETGLRTGEKLTEELLISGKQILTKHPKIFKSIEPNSQKETIKLMLDLIENALIQNDPTACINLLIKNVHGFTR